MHEVIQESVIINGQRLLSGELAYAIDASRALCLVCNPHPYMGGRMDNNVVARLAAMLSHAGIATLRFDYSGVGNSQGQPIDVATAMSQFWETGHAPVDELMIDDARNCLRWLRQQHDAPLFVAGYSFGAYAATRILPPDATGLILISPTLKQHDFRSAMVLRIPKLVVSSDNDFATDSATFKQWCVGLDHPKRERQINGGQHFFRGLESEVGREVLDFIDDVLHQGCLTT